MSSVSTSPGPANALPRVGRVVAQSTALVFVGYFAVGLEAAVVPTFVDRVLGLGTMLAGVALSSQALATLTSRGSAGIFTDKFGARVTVMRGLLLMMLSGLLFALATNSWMAEPRVQFSVLTVSRLMLGWGISWVSAAGAVWGIGRVGEGNASRILVWSGVAANAALGLGAPVGLGIASRWGGPVLGGCMAVLCLGGVMFATRLPDVERQGAEPLRLLAVIRKVAPFGSILGLAAVGYGVFSGFVTLFFQTQGWHGAAYPLALYGVSFVTVRIVLGKWIDRYSVFRVGLVSISVELCGVALLAVSHAAVMALVACCLMGCGFSLMFPALCVQTIRAVGPRDRASAISVFTAFLELSMSLSAPVAGVVIGHAGFRATFWSAWMVVLSAFVGLGWMARKAMRA